ncbi:hypothetical protein SCLCIDRAFT_1222989, partial [Scleroderma citrinum Foug A]
MCEYVDHLSINNGCLHPLEFDPPFFDCQEADELPVLVELGSGTGIVAGRIADSTFFPEGGIIVATDLPDVCPLLEKNLHKPGSAPSLSTYSKGSRVLVRPLAWGNIDHAIAIAQELGLYRNMRTICGPQTLHTRTLTHIICSDLVYFPELLGPLLRTLIHLTSLSCSTSVDSKPVRIVISYKIRSLPKESPFWSAFGLWFTFQPVLFRRGATYCNDGGMIEELGELQWSRFGAANADSKDHTFIFVAYRRPESFAWEVPPSDWDLIDGVGARGTPARKGDDTFETMLFMTMENV